MYNLHPLLLAILAVGATACDATRPRAVTQPPPHESAKPSEKRVTLADVGLDAASLDRTADPCQDFYQYACGGWLATHEIPADRVRWGKNIEVGDRIQGELRALLESAASEPAGTFYATCVDEAAREASGTAGIDPLLKTVRAVRDRKSLIAAVAELHRHKVAALFVIASEQDARDASQMIASIDQSDFGMLDRHHYLDDDARAKEIRAFYVEHVGRMLQLAGTKPAEAKRAAAGIVALEIELAKVWKTPVERRDPAGMYNKLDRAGLARLAPAWDWDAYFKALGFAGLREVNVTAPALLQGIERLLGSTKPELWRAYLEWKVLSTTAAALPKRFEDEAFALRHLVTGTERLPDRWKRCVMTTDELLGDALGRLFVGRHFAEGDREAVRGMIAVIREAFGKRLDQLDWMDAKTKQRAREKSKQMSSLIGYPSTWRVYDFPLDSKVHAANVLAARAFEVKHQLSRVGKPVDREEWHMTAPSVNAFYDPQRNQMGFPAGYLQPPFYSRRASVAVNMGAAGETIGHELTHGFDDAGSQYDAKGDLVSWWEPETRKRFEAKTQCVVDQFSAYETLGEKVNGKLTLGENLADLGGVELAFEAYRALRAGAAERLVADGFDEDQQFFLALAQKQCTKWREPRERALLKTGIHAPKRFRVNGAVTNMPEFAAAFSCAEGAPMNPRQRCEVW
ncbi:putative endopeptidase [Nannocystis exedens]|uniref:Putative endopeptidase n=1 Tax=Nannocystis exedens TaxID=54 RepID=A0A1I2IXW1_9BACT|nr:M13 family metallopeptidase [Nannocystis exedens]PCC72499.1 Neutral endopeptidase [Nannocystis exedens]SFF47114.1 putative endopeptidase [Nannocystis exedens]